MSVSPATARATAPGDRRGISRGRRFGQACAVGALASSLLAVGSTSALAGEQGQAGGVVASGLDNPRGMEWAHGRLLIAESGTGNSTTGPTRQCTPGIFAETICAARTGAVTEVTRSGRQRRIAEGLPSIANPDGSFAYGPSDVSTNGVAVYVSIGGPGEPEWRGTKLTAPFTRKFGTVQLLRGRHASITVADISEFTEANDPDGDPIESNTQSVLAGRGSLYAADSAGNTLLQIGKRGEVVSRHVFDDVVLRNGMTTDAVPTNLTFGPDGAVYVSTLTGFPFEAGLATIWRWDGQQATPYATGLTTAVDLAFGPDGSLYVVEMGGVNGLPPGRVRKIATDGSRSVVADGLDFPTGIAIGDGKLFVTNHGTSPHIGEVKQFPL
jgi:hypothetical protein